MDEKSQQLIFIERLKQAHWHVREQIADYAQHSRVDIIAYHPIFDENIAFELKVPQGFNDETKALRQMIRYRNTYFTRINVALFCYMKYEVGIPYHDDWISKRFFWRWGFGYGSLKTLIVEFVNGENKNTIDLAHPNEGFVDPKTKIRLIRETSKKYWMNDCDTDQHG